MDLSVIIPARNEIFLERTIKDILDHSRASTEVIAVLDGAWADPPIPDNPRVTLIYHSSAIGQRAACNEAAKISSGRYILKCDAHCSFASGFDEVLLEDIHDDWTIVPTMRNLHAFDWICKNGHRRYQGPSGACAECGEPTEKDIVWVGKNNPQSTAYCFDSSPHFQYFREFENRPEGRGKLTESMSLQGSCFMLSKNKWFELDICDETWGSWGSQGIEVAVKTWLSGGRVIVDKNTWYAHMFRTQGGDFSFPYPISGKQVEAAKSAARDRLLSGAWDKQKRPLSWLLQHFWPVPGWTQEDFDKLQRGELWQI